MIRARRPGPPEVPVGWFDVRDDPDVLEGYLEDASGAPPGRARGLARPGNEAEAAALVRQAADRGWTLLPQAARTSLTGGAIPDGDVVLSVESLRDASPVEPHPGGARCRFGAGIRLREMQRHVADAGFYFPPVPTYQEAMLGGTVSTNAGGAATFKYGVTREWVRGLTVVLPRGDVLDVERGQALARPGERFRIGLPDGGRLDVPTPVHRLPEIKKISAGYHSADPLDLVDLFVGSEGTLGLITSVTVELVPLPQSTLTGLVFTADTRRALDLAADLREAAERARARRDPRGPDVRAVEWMDARSLDLLRRCGDARRLRVGLPDGARSALLFEMELDEPADDASAQDLLAGFLEGGGKGGDRSLTRLFGILERHDALEELELAFPEDESRHRALLELRELVPQRVNEMLAARRRSDPAVKKVGGDLIVPFPHVAEMIDRFAEAFGSRGLEFAVWGHLADGNLHPNALPRTAAEVDAGVAALLELADEATRRGGCPLSEHGVGRSPVKQELLRRFLGEAAVAGMRRVKSALDPRGTFAPGVLFPAGNEP